VKPVILVTGAGGFLGCRLVEHLFGQAVTVRAMAHRPAGAVRLARLPVDIVWCDITRIEDVRSAMEGCDFVVHCAYGTVSDPRHAKAVTKDGTENLLKVAVEKKIKQFIHISTIAVYGYSPTPPISEDSPFQPPSDNYCRYKAQAEKAVWKSIRNQGLNATVLRMGNIYGPFSSPWTIRPLKNIQDGIECVVDGGEHASNMVFVDNAVEAILRTIGNSKASGESFFITDDEHAWREYYEEYARWSGVERLRSVTSQQVAEMERAAGRRVANWIKDLRENVLAPSIKDAVYRAALSKSMGPLAAAIWRPIPIAWRERILGPQSNPLSLFCDFSPPAMDRDTILAPLGVLQVYNGRVAFSNHKAKTLLGFGPIVSFKDAMEQTHEWAKWARLV
jgi:nucleoside-diphosphate-sugar epimerase